MSKRKRYIYNKDELKFEEYRVSPKKVVSTVLKVFLYCSGAALALYLLLTFVLDTPSEKKLRRENKYIGRTYDEMVERADMLHNTVQSLEYRDKGIYEQIFNSEPPDFMQRDTVVNYACLDSLYESRIVHETFLKCGMLSIQAAHNRTTIGNISLRMAYLGDSVRRIPSILPIRRFSIASTGASVGKKVNPFLKTVTDHEGIDLLAPIGTDVLATATGVVIAVSNSKSGFGKAVTISHGNGLSTFYCHLNDILVRRGQKITQGDVIGRVGNSGTSFAPHLHYAVFRDGVVQDPVNYFFADLDGKGYREMLLIATNTGQSLD